MNNSTTSPALAALITGTAQSIVRFVNGRWSSFGDVELKDRALRTVAWVVANDGDVKFENERAAQAVETAIMHEVANIDRKAYERIYPPCYMDANGNYTYDSSKWA